MRAVVTVVAASLLRDRSLFIAWGGGGGGGGAEDFRGDHLIFGRTKGGDQS